MHGPPTSNACTCKLAREGNRNEMKQSAQNPAAGLWVYYFQKRKLPHAFKNLCCAQQWSPQETHSGLRCRPREGGSRRQRLLTGRGGRRVTGQPFVQQWSDVPRHLLWSNPLLLKDLLCRKTPDSWCERTSVAAERGAYVTPLGQGAETSGEAAGGTHGKRCCSQRRTGGRENTRRPSQKYSEPFVPEKSQLRTQN